MVTLDFTAPLDALLAQLDGQALALIIRDLEDATNRRGAIDETTMISVSRACYAAGEQRFSRELFAALIAEYE